MILPNNGKVLIIDDNINEALPLIKMLSKNKTPVMYFSGQFDEFPDEPITGVRVVFLDLRFSTAGGEKNVVGNIIQILKKLISPNNGPFILVVWSKHETEYVSELKAELEKNNIHPEFIMNLTKSDHFETDSSRSTEFPEYALEVINRILGDDVGNQGVVDDLVIYLEGIGFFERKVSKPDSLATIRDRLKLELEAANLFSLFVLWENTINSAEANTVNEIYLQMPQTIPKSKLLAAMLYYMAYYRLEKNTATAGEQLKFSAAIDTLNEMFFYFYREETQKLDVSSIPNLTISNDPEFERNVSNEKYNKWMMTSGPSPDVMPGNIYEDLEKTFAPHALISGGIDETNPKLKLFNEQDGKTYVFVEISADCDIAQNKRCVSKIIPGLLIIEDTYQKLINEETLKKKGPEYICDFGVLEVTLEGSNGISETRAMRLLFNLNLATYRDIKNIKESNALFSLRKNFVVNLQTELGKLVSRQGIANF